ncbi:MAG: hypothetical protein R3B84_07815 [Zavarzinella sp.]
MQIRLLFCVMMLFACLSGMQTLLHAQGKLSEVRTDVKPKKDEDNDEEERKKRNAQHDDYRRRSSGGNVNPFYDDGLFLGIFLLGPEPLPKEYDPDADEVFAGNHRSWIGHLPYPFYSGIDGWLLTDSTLRGSDIESLHQSDLHEIAFRGGAEIGLPINDIFRLRGEVSVESATYQWGLSTTWDYYHESLPGGRTDSTTIGTINATLRALTSQVFLLRLGMGANILTDRYQTNGGINFLFQSDIFVAEPVSLTILGETGMLGSARTSHMRASVGYHLGHMQFTMGYDHRWIGDTNLSSPFAGIHFWY